MTQEEIVAMAAKARATITPGGMEYEELAPLGISETDLYVPGPHGKDVHIFRLAGANLPEKAPLIINFHGGGWLKPRLNWDRQFCADMIKSLNCLCFDVDYSLMPDSCFPIGAEEAYAVVKYVCEHTEEYGVDPDKIVLTGHSAGGNLAITVCMRNSIDPQFKLAGLMAEYSPLDLVTPPTEKPVFEGDMPASRAEIYNALYCPPEQAGDIYVSPLFAGPEYLKGFPETMILSAGRDRLCEENEEFAMHLARAGVSVTCKRYLDSRHSFTIQKTPGHEASMAQITKFIGDRFA